MGVQEQIDGAIADLRDVAMKNLIFGYERYLKAYFPPLRGEAVGDYLVVRNKADQSIAIFQEAGDRFRVADRANILDIGGGKQCDAAGVFQELARLNSGRSK